MVVIIELFLCFKVKKSSAGLNGRRNITLPRFYTFGYNPLGASGRFIMMFFIWV